MAVTALRREPDPDSDATRRTLNEEFRLQLDYAERRAREREQERSKTQATLGQPGGLVAANDPERVAKRLDRVTRYLAGGDPKESPQSATAENLVRSAVERATTSCGIAVPERADADGAAPTGVLLERVINAANFVDVRYLDSGVVAQHAVGRITIKDSRGKLTGYGTGFLVSPTLLLTNHHVLPDAATARTSIIELDYQDGIDGKPLHPTVFDFAPDRLFVADRELDFALVAVDADAAQLARFGYCPLTAAQGTVIIGESVTIVQHPKGEKKQIALRENRLVDIPELVLHYSADTEPGSSGSPVFNDQWEVVALHHASIAAPQHTPEYTILNEGIRISRILRFLAAAALPPDQRALVDELTRVSGPAPIIPAPAAHGHDQPDAGQARPAARYLAAPEASTDHVTVPGMPHGTAVIEIPLRITVEFGLPGTNAGPKSGPAVSLGTPTSPSPG